jgi:hypothetical protein
MFLGEGPKFLREKGTFPKKQCIFLRKTYVLNLFAITTISCLFLYRLVNYHWKGLEEGYNFVIGNISKTSHAKIIIQQSFIHICF